MGIIMKAALSVVLMLMIAFTTISTIGASNEAEAADSYMQQCAAELQVCNFNETVYEKIKDEAEEFGYVLTMDTVKDTYGDVQYAVIKMQYTYRMPLLDFESTHTNTIIAR